MSEIKDLHGAEGIKKVAELIKDIHICGMTTVATDGSVDTRPMACQAAEFDGTIWFLTRAESGKVAEIKNDDHVGLMFAKTSDESYVAVKGRASVSQDKLKIHELWNPMYKAWFEQGEDDPAIRVLRVDVSEAQYWESKGGKLLMGVKYLAAAVTGGKVEVTEQGKVTL